MSSKQIKQLDKLMATESKLDERQIERAAKELKKAEKAYEHSAKVLSANLCGDPPPLIFFQETKKAEAAYEKAVKQKLKTFKILGKAEQKRDGAAAGVEQAEKISTVIYTPSLFPSTY